MAGSVPLIHPEIEATRAHLEHPPGHLWVPGGSRYLIPTEIIDAPYIPVVVEVQGVMDSDSDMKGGSSPKTSRAAAACSHSTLRAAEAACRTTPKPGAPSVIIFAASLPRRTHW